VVNDIRQGGNTANQDTSAGANNQDANDGFDYAADDLMGRAFEQQKAYKRNNTEDDTVGGKDLRADKIKNVENDLHSDSFRLVENLQNTNLVLQTTRCKHLFYSFPYLYLL